MIEGFERETQDLNDAEIKLLPMFVAGFANKRGKENAVTNKEIVERLSQRGVKIGEPRVRKLINHIRNKGIVEGLIATSVGYYISEDIEEINKYILSLQSREEAIRVVREGFEAQVRRLKQKSNNP